MARRRFDKKALASVRKAAKAMKLEEKEERENSDDENKIQAKLTNAQRREIRTKVAEKQIKVIWNYNPGDLVKIKARYSPTGKHIIGLVTWGQKEVKQRTPRYDKKSLGSYAGNIRVMSPIGYNFYQPRALEKL
tara:strand:- start:4304 stop:4705 length:402 start_codon:yes stop_codon:yes gene_type:complete